MLWHFCSLLERDLISLRTKEALSAKRAQGQILGKPKGTLQKSKFDQNLEKIKELLGYGLSVRKIARVLGYTNHIALNTYTTSEGCTRLWKSEIQFDGIFEGLGVQPQIRHSYSRKSSSASAVVWSGSA